MRKNIFSNIKDTDALESFFECITSCSINSEGVDCTTACYTKHLDEREKELKTELKAIGTAMKKV